MGAKVSGLSTVTGKVAFFLSKMGAVVAMILMVAMTIHVMLEIVLRTLFSTSTFVLDEFVGYGVAAMTFLSLGYAFRTGVLIRVGLLLTKLRNRTLQRAVELLCVLSTLGLVLFIFKYFLKTVVRNWERGATSGTMAEVPLWLPESLVLVGLAIFAIQIVARVLELLDGGDPLALR